MTSQTSGDWDRPAGGGDWRSPEWRARIRGGHNWAGPWILSEVLVSAANVEGLRCAG